MKKKSEFVIADAFLIAGRYHRKRVRKSTKQRHNSLTSQQVKNIWFLYFHDQSNLRNIDERKKYVSCSINIGSRHRRHSGIMVLFVSSQFLSNPYCRYSYHYRLLRQQYFEFFCLSLFLSIIYTAQIFWNINYSNIATPKSGRKIIPNIYHICVKQLSVPWDTFEVRFIYFCGPVFYICFAQ